MTSAGIHPFDRATTLEPIGSRPDDDEDGTERWGLHLDPAWWVGDAGPWGGYVTSCFARAFAQTVPELPVVSLGVHFVRRMRADAAELVVRVESRGSRVGHLTGRLVQDGRATAVALATVGSNPQPDLVTDFPRPDTPGPDEVRRRTESSHSYMQHIDVRPTIPVHPWSGTDEGTLEGWVALAEPRPLDLPLVAALSDAWSPGMWARLTTPAGKVTLDLTTHFRAAVETSGRWCYLRLRTRHVERGFADEECVLWSEDGAVLSQSRQLVLLSR